MQWIAFHLPKFADKLCKTGNIQAKGSSNKEADSILQQFNCYINEDTILVQGAAFFKGLYLAEVEKNNHGNKNLQNRHNQKLLTK